MSKMTLICVTTGYGNYHEPVYITYADHAKELKANLDKLCDKYNKAVKDITKAKVVSLWNVEYKDSTIHGINPYTFKPQLVSIDNDLSEVRLYDTSTNTIESLNKFEEDYLKDHPDYAKYVGRKKFYELDYNLFSATLEHEVLGAVLDDDDEMW